MNDAGRGFSLVSHAAAGAPLDVIRRRGLRVRFFSAPAAATEGTFGATGTAEGGGGTATGFFGADAGFTLATTLLTAFATVLTAAAAFDFAFVTDLFAAGFATGFDFGVFAATAFAGFTGFAALAAGFGAGFLTTGFAAAFFAGADAFFAGADFFFATGLLFADGAAFGRATVLLAAPLRAPPAFFTCALAINRFLFYRVCLK